MKEPNNQSNRMTDLCGAPQKQVQEKPLQSLESGDLAVILLILPGRNSLCDLGLITSFLQAQFPHLQKEVKLFR